MLAAQQSKRPAHGLGIERVARMPGMTAQKGMRDRTPIDQIKVALAQGPAPRVEARRRLGDREHADGLGQQRIESARQAIRRHPGGGGEARHLGESVDARVGAAGPGDLDGLSENSLRGRHHEPLHGGAAGLHLPALEVRAVVRQGQAQGAQGRLSG